MTRTPKVCFDRVLPRDLMRFQTTVPDRPGQARGLSPIGKTWINGSTLHVRFMGGTAQQKKKVQEQAAWWTAHANLQFVFDDAPAAEIRIAFDDNDGAWSYIGTDAKSIPVNEPTMNLGFLDGGTAAHEFGHAIGLAHEHQNPADIRSPSAGSVRNPGQVGKPRVWIPAAAAILLVVLGITAAVVASGTRDETAVDASSDRANAGAANADSDDFAVESQLEDPAAPQTTVSPSPDRGAGDPAEESADADEPPGDAIPESGSEAVPGAEGGVPGADGGQPDSRDTANAALSAFAGVRAVIVLQLP